MKQLRVTGWGGRLVRRWWPDRNPVRRRWDRMEAAVIAGLMAAFLAGAPLSAAAAEGWAHGVAQHAQRAQQASWHRVPAVLAARAPAPANAAYAGDMLSQVRATWTAPGGEHRSGLVLAPAGAAPGSRVKVWVDHAGNLTGPPLADHQVAEQAVLAAAVACAVLGLLLLGGGLLARRLLDVRRMAAWDAEWRVTGPRWSPRR